MKVALLGTAPGYARAPYGDPTWEIWGLNDAYDLFGPCTRWFELHGDTPLTRARRSLHHFDRIAALEMPVYYLHGEPPTPTAIKLDTDALARVGRDYFACTTSYQIALALQEGATDIALYGLPFAANREVVVERPCVAYWLGVAEGRGVRVSVEHDEPVGLLRHPYRYAEADIEERQASYDAAYRLFWSLARWIPTEASRLTMLSQDATEGAGCVRCPPYALALAGPRV